MSSSIPLYEQSTLRIKLRNPYTEPPKTATYYIPHNRSTSTSPYLRSRVQSHNVTQASPFPTVRLNFPHFETFELYIEWLITRRIFLKRDLRRTQGSFSGPQKPNIKAKIKEGSKTERDKDENQPDTQDFHDYLNSYFLATWLQDATSKIL